METKNSKDEPGQKFDHGKPRYDLIPGDSLEQIAIVYTYGATKYADNNWRQGMSWSRMFGAMMRHAWAFWRGESIDEESGCQHLAMVAFYCLGLMSYEKTRPEFDDRVRDLNEVPPIEKRRMCVECMGDPKENKIIQKMMKKENEDD